MARDIIKREVAGHKGPYFISFDETAWGLSALNILMILWHYNISRPPLCLATVATTASMTAKEVHRNVMRCVHDFHLNPVSCVALMADGAVYVQKAGNLCSHLFFACVVGRCLAHLAHLAIGDVSKLDLVKQFLVFVRECNAFFKNSVKRLVMCA